MAVHRAADGRAVHLVGGALRDLALGLPVRDWDFVVSDGGAVVAQRLAEALPGRLIRLGGDRWDAYRVAGTDSIVDIWDRRGAELEADLGRRDLTIHSIAFDLDRGRIVDPWRGLDDLDGGLLRAPSPGRAFDDDPLRVLRLARFFASLDGFRIDGATLGAAGRAASRLDRVAGERVREELELTLAAPAFDRTMEALLDCHLFPAPVPCPAEPANAAAPSGARRAASRLERVVSEVRSALGELATVGDWTLHIRLLHLSLLVALTGTPLPALDALERRGWVRKGLAARSRRILPWSSTPTDEPGRRWLLHETGDAWPTALTFAIALGTGEAEARELLHLVERHEELLFSAPPWIDGHEAGRLTGLRPGPELGRWLRASRRWQIEGSAVNATQARDRLTRLAHRERDDSSG